MSEPDPLQVTQMLRAAADGDAAASEQLLPLVYSELRRLAQGYMDHERGAGAGYTLQATALVHEAYLRLVGGSGGDGRGPAEVRRFVCAAGESAARRYHATWR